MERFRHYALYILVGAAAFWVPDLAIQWLRPPHRVWMALLTFLVPVVVGLVFLALSRRPAHARHRIGVPLFMLLGIWMLGPLAMAVGAIPAGGRFLEMEHVGAFLVLWAAFPISTFIMATHSGSLGGLGLTSALLLIAAAVAVARRFSSGRPLDGL